MGRDARARDDAALLAVVVDWVAASLADGPPPGAPDRTGGPVVAAHVPIDTEPGATVDAPSARDADEPGAGFPDALLHALDERVPGVRLLLPVCPPGPPAALGWAVYRGQLAPGKFGLPEPVGRVLGPEAVGEADVVLVPGLAGDAAGMRMGRGAGYYDRTLSHATGKVALLLHPDEVIDSVPHDDHDLPVDAILTAKGAITIASRSDAG